MSRYQKGKANLDFTEARDSEWQWHALSHMQLYTSLQTDNHASTPPLSFLQAGCPSCRPTNSVKALKAFAEVMSADRIFRRHIDGIEGKVVKAFFLLSGDIELNPGPANFTLCTLNIRSILQYVDTVNQFVKLCKGSSVVIFSDGSVCNGPVGSGACAAVLYPLLDTEEVVSSTKAVGKVSREQCETEGIIHGMEIAINYLNAYQSNKGSGRILVFCDCESAIDTVDRKLVSVRYPEIFKRLSAIQSQLKEMDKYVNLEHIPGHTGIIGNDLVDEKQHTV